MTVLQRVSSLISVVHESSVAYMFILFEMICFSQLIFFSVVCFTSAEGAVDILTLPPPCDNNIFCHGPLLHTVQMAELFHDSKTFVDMKIKESPNKTLAAFEELMNKTNHQPSQRDVKLFVQQNFDKEGSEFVKWIPDDWISTPSFLSKIKNPLYRSWGSSLNSLWKVLGRKMVDDVKHNRDLYSIIYVPNPVIVPGGRFREFYYWDSYWIIRGLLLSEMTHTARGMLENFISIVEEYGFIPNGGRVYYAMRSQPPLLIPMVDTYVQHTNDFDFVKNCIHTLEAEFNFWLTNHTVPIEKNGKVYNLAVYKDASSGPRPESYKEDVKSAYYFKTEREKHEYYAELKAAAESGWDFSSRWFISNGTNIGNLTSLKTRYIVPVDLNAFLYGNARILQKYYTLLNDTSKSSYYDKIALNLREAVDNVLWHEEFGTWLDYDRWNNISRPYFYPSNVVPLWTECYDLTQKNKIIRLTMKYLEKNNITEFKGVPTSFLHTGEQWDYPNAWPPLQYMMIMGLDNTNDSSAQRLAYELSDTWVRSNFVAFNESEAMYEKYDALNPGGHGGGGEYDVQIGFGWSNGVIMDLLNKYGDRMKPSDFTVFADTTTEEKVIISSRHQQSSGSRPLLTGLLALIISLSVGFIGVVIYKKRCSNQDLWSRTPLGRSKAHYTELRSMSKRTGHTKPSTSGVRSLR